MEKADFFQQLAVFICSTNQPQRLLAAKSQSHFVSYVVVWFGNIRCQRIGGVNPAVNRAINGLETSFVFQGVNSCPSERAPSQAATMVSETMGSEDENATKV
jgi:hypothetical protein